MLYQTMQIIADTLLSVRYGLIAVQIISKDKTLKSLLRYFLKK